MLHYLGVFLLGFSIGTLAMIWAWWVYDALPEMEALKEAERQKSKRIADLHIERAHQ